MQANRLHLVGAVHNFTNAPAATPLDAAHRGGLTFVAMDARAYPDFTGSRPLREWVVVRAINHDAIDARRLDGWPDTGWRFDDQGKARAAYQAMRAHAAARLPGVEIRDDRGPARRLNDPANALGEAFTANGTELLHLSCDVATEARVLEMITDRLEPYTTKGANPTRYAAYSTQTAPHVLALGVGARGVAEHVIVAFSPANEHELIAGGLDGSVRDTDAFMLDVPSGILVIAWGRLDGAGYLQGAPPGTDPAAVFHNLIGQRGASPLGTPYDAGAPGPLAWGVRVAPGPYHCALRFLDTEAGISAMCLSSAHVMPLWPDHQAPPPKAQPMMEHGARVQAAQQAQAAVAAGQGGDPDPVVFPGQPIARLSDYVNMMKQMQTGDMQGAMKRFGLTVFSLAPVTQAWQQKLTSDATLFAKYSAMMTSK